MYPITNEVKALFESEQRKVLRITGTDKNGRSISITDDNVIADSFQVDRYSCNGEKLEIGTAIAAQLTLALENDNGQYDSIAFEGAELFVEVGVADWTQSSPTIHWVPCGYFTPDEQPRRMTTIRITALDRMTNFDAVSPALTPWTTANGEYMTDSQGNIIYFMSSLEFPATITNIIKRVALLCSVPFTQSLVGFPNANLVIDQMPVLEQTVTYRNVIQWCAGIMGANAWIDWTGSLRFSWYNNTTNYTSTVDNRYSSDMQENDITITGVYFTNENNIKIVSGTDDYAISMSGNYLADMKISTILPAVNAAVNGFTYRPFQASSINAPYLWPMDIVTFTDKDGNDHSGALTNVTFGLNGSIVLQSKGEAAETNSRVKPSNVNSETAQMIERAAQVARNLDESLDQEGIFNRLTDGGEIQGLLLYDGKVYLNASYINTGTLAANFIKGGTLSLGGMNNEDGVLHVLDANGNIIGVWDKDGITVSKGSITGGTINGATLTLGGNNNASGTLTVKDANGNTIGTWNNNGLTLNKGSIAGPSVTLGGSGNANGTLTVKDANGNTIGTWNNSGISVSSGSITGGTINGASLTLGGSGNASGTLTVKDASGNTLGYWDNTGIHINTGEVSANSIKGGTLNVNVIGNDSIGLDKLSGSITNDGWNINLTAGTMSIGNISANNINTGTLSVGGGTGRAGAIAIYNANGTLIGSINSNGLTLNNNSGVTQFVMDSTTGNATFAGALSAATGTFAGELSAATGTFAGTLSANCITTGTLNADRIGGHSIGVAKLTGSITNGNWGIDFTAGTMSIGNISADNINTGTLSVGGGTGRAGAIAIYNANGTLIGSINSNGLTLNNNSGVTQFVMDSTTGNATFGGALNAATGTFAGTLSADSVEGGTLILGGINDGSITIKDYSDAITGTIDKDGITLWKPRDDGGIVSAGFIHMYNNIFQIRGIDELRVSGDNAFLQLAATTATFSCNLSVTGTKSRLVSTSQYSDRLLYCYETPTPMFGDIGDGVISDDGICYVILDAVFAQTVTTEQYQVFLQKYGPGDCWVRERKGAYFIVEGTPGLSFGWEVKAKQRDYDQLRLDRNDEKFTIPTQTYGEDAAKHINDIQKERIPA